MKAKAIVLAMVMALFLASCSAPEANLSHEDTSTFTVDTVSVGLDTLNTQDRLFVDSVAVEN